MSVSKKLEAHKYGSDVVNWFSAIFTSNNITDDNQKSYLLKYFYSKQTTIGSNETAKEVFNANKDEGLKQYKNEQIMKTVAIGLAVTLGLGIVGYVGFRVYKSRANNQ